LTLLPAKQTQKSETTEVHVKLVLQRHTRTHTHTHTTERGRGADGKWSHSSQTLMDAKHWCVFVWTRSNTEKKEINI